MALRLRMTRKKTLHLPEKESERVQKLRQEYWEQIRDFLDIALAEAFKAVLKEDFRNWFTHGCYCTSSI